MCRVRKRLIILNFDVFVPFFNYLENGQDLQRKVFMTYEIDWLRESVGFKALRRQKLFVPEYVMFQYLQPAQPVKET
jgi:hypothetical protein